MSLKHLSDENLRTLNSILTLITKMKKFGKYLAKKIALLVYCGIVGYIISYLFGVFAFVLKYKDLFDDYIPKIGIFLGTLTITLMGFIMLHLDENSQKAGIKW